LQASKPQYNGAYAPLYWGLLACNVLIPQALWFRRVRLNGPLLWVIALLINVGMWLERFIIIVQSLSKDFLPSSWHLYAPTIFDISVFVGTIGLFFVLLFMFVRLLPAISIFEMRELVGEQSQEHREPQAVEK
jgi:molybdopterin-containing oxidoreductase family membrane subunit